MIKYKVTKQEGGDVEFERSGAKNKFTASEMMENIKTLSKLKTQLLAQKKLEDAKMKNVESNHAFVKDMEDKALSTAHTYWEAKLLFNACDNKLKEVDEMIDEEKECVVAIEAQTGINVAKYGKK